MDQMRHNSICNIQAAWRGYVTKKDFSQTVSKIVLIQSLVRKVDAYRLFQYLREVKYVEESEAATKIASFVKCSLSVTKQKTEVISNMQSIRETESKASTDISKSWRKAKCMWGYKQTISGKSKKNNESSEPVVRPDSRNSGLLFQSLNEVLPLP